MVACCRQLHICQQKKQYGMQAIYTHQPPRILTGHTSSQATLDFFTTVNQPCSILLFNPTA